MTHGPSDSPSPRPLDGFRVVEMGQLVAGPAAATLLAYFGAEVVKIEPPAGDPIRTWRVLDDDGTSLWWRALGRNKRVITADLRTSGGQEIARRLIARADVLIENFRPGTLERWNLDPKDLQAERPELIVIRVSGFGQTGPYAARPGYAAVCEGYGGLRHVTGVPGEKPVRANLSLGDSVAALHAVIGCLLAALERERRGGGQVVDVSIVESVFALMEGAVPELDRRGVVREPAGSTITGVVPSNTYPCREGQWVILGANSESLYRSLMRAIGREDLAVDPRLASNPGRVAHQAEIDDALAAWTVSRSVDEVLEAMEVAGVPAGPIYSVADQRADPHFQARGLFEKVGQGDRNLELGAIPPRLEGTPGQTQWVGREIGEDTDAVLRELGWDDAAIRAMRRQGVV